jgi:hypothetical protein
VCHFLLSWVLIVLKSILARKWENVGWNQKWMWSACKLPRQNLSLQDLLDSYVHALHVSFIPSNSSIKSINGPVQERFQCNEYCREQQTKCISELSNYVEAEHKVSSWQPIQPPPFAVLQSPKIHLKFILQSPRKSSKWQNLHQTTEIISCFPYAWYTLADRKRSDVSIIIRLMTRTNHKLPS